MGYDRRVDQRSVLMDEQFHEGSEDFRMCVSGEHQVCWCHACDTDTTIANSYKKSNADVGPYYEIALITGSLLCILYTCSPR